MLTRINKLANLIMKQKRLFDILFSFLLLVSLSWLLIIIYLIVLIDIFSNALYKQYRVGQFGALFIIYKFKTIHPISGKISFLGKFLRKYKLDELPQLINILIGNMSFVGPRPDIPGYYDLLEGENRKILELKPGLTSSASIKYANEEEILGLQENPLLYNDTIIFPDKIRMNLDYYYNNSTFGDIKIILKTIFR
jgi:lipopolysaccharide/colanic/teichoic acid biosynthesis glycosyltransferase